jgi:hypothetical protein
MQDAVGNRTSMARTCQPDGENRLSEQPGRRIAQKFSYAFLESVNQQTGAVARRSKIQAGAFPTGTCGRSSMPSGSTEKR